jgi:hypothetical protein
MASEVQMRKTVKRACCARIQADLDETPEPARARRRRSLVMIGAHESLGG